MGKRTVLALGLMIFGACAPGAESYDLFFTGGEAFEEWWDEEDWGKGMVEAATFKVTGEFVPDVPAGADPELVADDFYEGCGLWTIKLTFAKAFGPGGEIAPGTYPVLAQYSYRVTHDPATYDYQTTYLLLPTMPPPMGTKISVKYIPDGPGLQLEHYGPTGTDLLHMRPFLKDGKVKGFAKFERWNKDIRFQGGDSDNQDF